ncbi:MAG: type I glyceraldehyde-3-phosphate dehydrogenase [Marinifilaceae bacterium]|jgi:glyceraldehyde 3-phosphate dehydrogenase|nr:type I glyceraldehyde-3-phosphate dehydrogenase [Marinifilaceae bacterium]
MSKIKIAINGFGRIGRNVVKIALNRDDIEIVGINGRTGSKVATMAHLFKYDSTQGRYPGEVSHDDENIIVDGVKIKVCTSSAIKDIKWPTTPDVVIESTGKFKTRHDEKGGYGDHLLSGAKKVLLTFPAKDEVDNMIVMGVNEESYKPEHDICVSNASCTTNCLAPIVKVMHDNFNIVNGMMTTIHSYTLDQKVLDGTHKDLRRARACNLSQIPTSTGAAVAVGKVIPELNGKLDGMAVRVPTPTGSLVDMVFNLENERTIEEINSVMKKAAESHMKGIIEYTEDPIVSCDVIHNPSSAIFDALSTMVIGKMVKVLAWYDNEWGYSNRVVDLAVKIGNE